jgi:hypothetical protein
MVQKVEIFPVTCFKETVKENEEIKKILVPKIMEVAPSLSIPEGWLTNKIMTSFMGEKSGKEIFFGEDKIYETILEERYINCFDNILENTKYKISIDEIWYNCYINGEFQEEHDHLSICGKNGNTPPPHFSCIHFLSFDPTRHNPVTLYDPIRQIRCMSYNLGLDEYGEYCNPNIEEGDLLMFPSFLRHSVSPSPKTLDYPRITISMNLSILEYECLNR